MKYQVSTGAAPAAKKFDFDKAMESLTATYERLGEASENLLAVDASLAEVSQVMEDCGSALKSIQTFGVAKENMSLLNGSNNALDDALGLEHLDINAIESLSDSTKKALKKSYEAGLEGVISDAWDKFVAFLKKMWEAVKRFFIELFNRDVKMKRLIGELIKSKDINKIDEEATAPAGCAKAADVIQAIKLLANLEKNFKLDSANWLDDQFDKSKVTFGIKDGKRGQYTSLTGGKLPDSKAKEGATLKDLGWDTTKVMEAAQGAQSVAGTPNQMKAMKELETKYAGLVAEAEKAKDDKAKQKEVKDMGDKLAAYKDAVQVYENLLGKVDSCVVKILELCPNKGDKKDTGARD